jgi:murein DD-endopeptidase MepM/ murein hydrolase activator NlpD
LAISLAESLRFWLARTELMARRHPRTVSSAVATLLLGTAVTAMGVAPLALVDTSAPPQRLVTQMLQPERLQPQIEAMDLSTLSLHRSDTTRRGDTVDSLLKRLGVDDPQAAAFLRSDAMTQQILQGHDGKLIRAELKHAAGSALLQRLVVKGPPASAERRESHYSRISIERTDQGLQAHAEELPLQAEARLGSGTIETSLFAAADDAGLPDAVTVRMAEIFGSDIDFRRELRRGDTFAVVYESLSADGEPASWLPEAGRVLAARFINKGERHEAIWFQGGSERGAYYGANGLSKTRSFLSSPLTFSRVSSGFAMRFHPILQKWRAHLGVDYAAPTGTPVRAVGQGEVEFAGVQNGYGNVVVVKHSQERSTVYAHLSRIDVRQGAKISQGATLGAVGATGWATGPHLHFEFKVKGQQMDPVQIARSSETVALTAEARARFQQTARAALDQLNAVDLSVASRAGSAPGAALALSR